MSTLYVCSNVYNVNYTRHLLPFVELYEVDTIICDGGDRERLRQWTERWMMKAVIQRPPRWAVFNSDASVIFELATYRPGFLVQYAKDANVPYAVFTCDDEGDVIGIS